MVEDELAVEVLVLSEIIYQYTIRLSRRTSWPALVDTKYWQEIYSNYYWLRYLDCRLFYWTKYFIKFCTNRINSTVLAQDRYGYIEISILCPTQLRVGLTPILSTWSPFLPGVNSANAGFNLSPMWERGLIGSTRMRNGMLTSLDYFPGKTRKFCIK